jgi:hypothetical protein
MFQLSGFYESVDQGAAAADIAAIQDDTLYTSGDILRVPPAISNLVGTVALSAATTVTSAQVQTPSLRTLANYDVSAFINAAVFGTPPVIDWFQNNVMPLVGNESMTFNTNTDHASAIAIYGLVWLSDGNLSPVDGEIFTVRCTGAASLSAGSWVASNLTFTQDLPFGEYQVVGMRAVGTNLVAARLIFPGGSWRPGVPAVNAISDEDFHHLRNGMTGVWDTFDYNQPPTLECLGVTDSAQTIFLDLIKVG